MTFTASGNAIGTYAGTQRVGVPQHGERRRAEALEEAVLREGSGPVGRVERGDAGGPVRPGEGCGDKNAVHEHEEECKKTPK